MNQKVIDAYRFEREADCLCVIPPFHNGPKFNKEEALELSIRKWEALVVLSRKSSLNDGGVDTCALCFQFSCLRCPVGQATSLTACIGTPHDTWRDAQNLVYEGELTRPEIAQLEVKFLESLRK